VHVTSVTLEDYRSYATVTVPLTEGVTTFVGRNGVGKTNLVEAVGYASSLSSHRVSSDAPLVRTGAERAMIRLDLTRGGRAVSLEVEVAPGRSNRARLNRGAVTRAREILGVLTTVIFAPEDLSLIKGDPGERRRFLDDLSVQLRPAFAGVRADYERVLKQRNALLRSAASGGRGGVDQTLRIWDEQLAAHGADIMVQRAHLVDQLSEPVREAYRALAPESGELSLAMASAAVPGAADQLGRDAVVAALLSAMEDRRREEIARGVTLVGPQRDDLTIGLGDHPAKGYASHGESWSCALALKIGAFHLLRDVGDGGDPVLILDDVFAELDTGRRDRLATLVADAEQVLITAAVAEDIPPALVGQRVDVEPGSARARSGD